MQVSNEQKAKTLFAEELAFIRKFDAKRQGRDLSARIGSRTGMKGWLTPDYELSECIKFEARFNYDTYVGKLEGYLAQAKKNSMATLDWQELVLLCMLTKLLWNILRLRELLDDDKNSLWIPVIANYIRLYEALYGATYRNSSDDDESDQDSNDDVYTRNWKKIETVKEIENSQFFCLTMGNYALEVAQALLKGGEINLAKSDEVLERLNYCPRATFMHRAAYGFVASLFCTLVLIGTIGAIGMIFGPFGFVIGCTIGIVLGIVIGTLLMRWAVNEGIVRPYSEDVERLHKGSSYRYAVALKQSFFDAKPSEQEAVISNAVNDNATDKRI
jgi:hypothetical protein